MKTSSPKQTMLAVAGWLAVVAFFLLYLPEFFPHHGPPTTVRFLRENFGNAGLIVLNIVIVLAFLALLPYRRPTKAQWKSRGAFAAFVIALMTEMFGWPLVIFLVSPFFEIPTIARSYFDALGHWPARLGTALSLLGVVLIVVGWRRIHAAEGLVDQGIYSLIRHPQYSGIFLFTLGWILHWPSLVTLAIWPLLLLAYYWLARYEEKMAIEDFGTEYEAYMARTKRFVPWVF